MQNTRVRPAFAVLFCTLLLHGCGDKTSSAADTVFTNGKLYTVNAAQPWAEAVAIDGDSIVYVGDNAGALALVGDDTVQYDLG